jgi:hypothetical protein
MTQVGQCCQDRQALRNYVLMRRETVIGERFPFDEMSDRQLACGKEADFGLELIGMSRIACQHEDRTAEQLGVLGRRKRRGRADQSADRGWQAGESGYRWNQYWLRRHLRKPQAKSAGDYRTPFHLTFRETGRYCRYNGRQCVPAGIRASRLRRWPRWLNQRRLTA